MDSLGARFKQIRQEKGISLEEAQKKTKIHPNILKAIEGDTISDINPTYLKGFLKIYCKFLKLEPKDYIQDYKEPSLSEPAVAVTRGERRSFKLKLPPGITKVLLTIIAVAVLSALLFNLGRFMASHRKNKAVLAGRMPVSAPSLKKEQPSEKIPAKKENFSGVNLVIKANEDCWIVLKADGKLVFKRILGKGRSESWQAKDRIELSLGNAGAVELEVNGRIFSRLGKRGQKLSKVLINKEGLQIAQ